MSVSKRSKRSTDNCPTCIPLNLRHIYAASCSHVDICKTKKIESVRNAFPCPPCLPLNEVKTYKNLCVHTPLCYRRRKMVKSCPDCVPQHLLHVYENCRLFTPVCRRRKRYSCPPCIPISMTDYYESINSCLEKPICARNVSNFAKGLPSVCVCFMFLSTIPPSFPRP